VADPGSARLGLRDRISQARAPRSRRQATRPPRGRGPHYWILDPGEKILLVHRWSHDGYTVVQRAAAGETVRAEPFDAIELRVGVLFGDDEDE
jgi:hypothetical protein